MQRNWHRILNGYEVIVASIIIGLSAYIIDAEIDAFIFHNGQFLDVLLLAVPLAELYTRLYILASFIIFGIFVSRILAKRKNAEGALRESEKRYRNLVETAPEVIYTLSEDGRITSLNPAFEKLTGWSHNEWIGKNFAPIVHPDDLPIATETFQKSLCGETLPPVEIRILSKSGEYLVGEFTSAPLTENGKVIGEFGVVRNITERKRAEEALKKEQERFQDIAVNTGDWIWETDSDGKYTYVSPMVKQLLGYEPEEVLGKHFYDFFLSEEREQLKEAAFEAVAQRECLVNFTSRNVHKNGHIIILETNGAPIISPDGQLLGYRGVKRDITERKRYEERLSALNIYSRNLNTAKSMEEIYELTLDAAEKILGFEFADFLTIKGKTLYLAAYRGASRISSLELPLDGDKGITVSAARAGQSVLVPDVSKEKAYVEGGLEIHSELAVPIKIGEKVLGALNVESKEFNAFDQKDQELLEILAAHAATAMSNLDHAENLEASAREIRESQEKFKRLFMDNPEAAVYVDSDFHIVDANPRFSELFGYSADEIKGKRLLDLVVPEDKKEEAKMLDKESKNAYTYHDTVRKKKDGTLVPVSVSAAPIIVEDQPIGYVGLYRDITERKKSEMVLQESEERFRSVVENSHDGILIVDDDFRLVYVNNELCRISGYSREEIVGQDFRKFLGEDIISLCQGMYLRRQRGKEVPSSYKLKMVRKDGEKRDIEIKSTILRDSRGKMQTVVQILDVTTQKRVEEERKRYEGRLSALNFYSGKLNTADSLQQVYELTLDAMEKTLGFEDATFMVIERDNLKTVCQRGYQKPILIELPLDSTKKGITVRATNTCKSILVPDVKKDKDYVEGVPGIQSELAVPVIAEDKVLGVLDVESKNFGAFDEKDIALLQILASHAATAISNIKRRKMIENRSSQMVSLMKSSAQMIHSTDLRQRLQTTAEAIRELGWQRVVISARDETLDITNPEDIVTAGLTEQERDFLWTNRQPGQVWRDRFGPEYERFKIGEFYHLPWSDPWVRKRFSEGTVESHIKPEEMVDWDPQDLLYAPLRLADGRIVGVASIDDPLDGKRPTKESLAPLELFLHQAAVAIENAKLIQQLSEAKKQIKEYAGQLELKVEQRTKELVEAQNRLLKSERLAAIGEIAAMVGHDLRNPLTGIANATYYLKMKSSEKMGKQTGEMLNIIQEDIEYSNKIVNDLLEYSREMKLEYTETTPKVIVKEALSLVKVPKNIHVLDSAQTDPKTKVDIEKMKRVFVNIIKNAIDAMPRGGTLTIKSNKIEGNLEIAFTDTGKGMQKKIIEKLWTPLFTTKAKGMGLGLAICKRIVEAHGGNISAESTVGKGTTFTVTIPIQPLLEEGGEKTWVKMPESLLSTTTKA